MRGEKAKPKLKSFHCVIVITQILLNLEFKHLKITIAAIGNTYSKTHSIVMNDKRHVQAMAQQPEL